MNIVLKAGLAVRRGQQTLELTRVLSDSELQFEETLTRRVSTIRTSDLLKRIWSGEYKVVMGTAEMRRSGPSELVAVQADELQIPTLVDLGNLKSTWTEQIDYRMRYLKGLQAGHVTRGNRKRVAAVIRTVASSTGDMSPPSASTVMDWARRYQTSDCNPLALVDRTKTTTRSRRLPKRVEEIFATTLREQYFTRARSTLRHAHDCIRRELAIAKRNGEIAAEDAKVGYTTLVRRVGEVDLYHRIASREGEARARHQCRTTMEGAAAAYPLQRVEVDHTLLDWVVIDDERGLPLGRPLLTIAMDAGSGYITGMYLSFYGASVTSVVGVLRSSFMPKSEITQCADLKNPWLSRGLADEWVLDNGMEFHSKQFKAVSWELGIDMTYCRVRTPWLKPHVERFFATLKNLPLSVGRVHKTVANALNVDPYKTASIGFNDLVKGMLMYVVDVHPFEKNERKLARPFDLFQEGLRRCPPAIFPGSADRLRLVSGMSKQHVVSQGGIQLHGLPYGGAELLALRHKYSNFKTTIKWDPDDIGSIFVQHPQQPTEWIQSACRWDDYAAGLSYNQHRVIRNHGRQLFKDQGGEEQLWAARLDLHDHFTDASRPKDRKNSLKAARAAGITSVRPLGLALTRKQEAPEVLVDSQDRTPAEEILEFDAFDMEQS
ncbi:MAG: Mu transposase C-terminal domain-containing protein [Bacteroidia bacterium]|jgi:putative transposase